MVSFVWQTVEKINDDHDGNLRVLCIREQFDDKVEAVNCALPKVADITYKSKVHTATKETTTLPTFYKHRLQVIYAEQMRRLSGPSLRHIRRIATAFWYFKHQ